MIEHLKNTSRTLYKGEYFIRIFMLLALSQLILIPMLLTYPIPGFLIAVLLIDGFLFAVVYFALWAEYKKVPLALTIEDKYLAIQYKKETRRIEWDKILYCTPSNSCIIRLVNGEKIDLKAVDDEIVARIYKEFLKRKADLEFRRTQSMNNLYCHVPYAIYERDIFRIDTTGRYGYGKPRKDGKHLLYTRVREKAMKHGFVRGDYYYYKVVEPDEYEPRLTKKKYYMGNFYFVKYGEDFFDVEDDFFTYAPRLAERTNGRYPYPEERGDMVFIYTIYMELRDKYDLVDVEEDYHDIEMGKWVKESEITPVDKTDERLANYKGIVCQILDQRDNEYLIASGLNDEMMPWYTDDRFHEKPREPGWQKVGNKWMKWMPAEKLYIYGEEEIPPRI